MRIVMLCSSPFSETACATTLHLAEKGYVPVGALTLRALHGRTLLRKLGQLGLRGAATYASAKLFASNRSAQSSVQNCHLLPFLKLQGRTIQNLSSVAKWYRFPLSVCTNQNSIGSLKMLKAWAPDLIIFTGGNILRKPVLQVPRLGALNVHLGSLPQIRGMSSPEWSVLSGVPPGLTVHYMDEGIDTGPVLRKYELPNVTQFDTLQDLRNQLIAVGVQEVAEVVAALERGTISAKPQAGDGKDGQYFVMHEFLRAQAAQQLASNRPTVWNPTNG